MKPNLSDAPEPNLTLERLRSLYELIGRMNSVYDLPELLEFVVDQALSLTGGQRGLLLLNDGHEQSLQSVAVARGLEDAHHLDQVLKFVSTTVIQDVLDRGEPRLVLDLQADQRFADGASRATLVSKRVRSVLAVPLKIETRLVGLIYIDHPRRAVFGQSDLDFLSAFANQSALAINRARQHQHQLAELALLNELSRSVVQVLDLDEVLTRIVNEATRMLNVETGSVLLLDEVTAELFFATSVSEGKRINIPTRLQPDQGIAGWVVSTGQAACISNVSQEPRWFGEVETGFVTRSLLAVPLSLEGQALGVLQVLNKKSPTGFNPDDIAQLSAFATWATIAIQNARLFQQASQARQLAALNSQLSAQTKHLTYLNEVGTALTSSLELAHVLKVIIEGVNVMLETERTSVFLIEPDTNELVLCYSNEGDANIRLPAPWQGIAGWVATHDQPALVNNTLSDPRHLRQIAIETGYQAHSILCVPLKVGGEVIGVVEVLNKRGGQQFTHYHQVLLIELTRWAAIAVHNARLFDERVQAFQRLAAEQQRRIAAETRGAMAAVILDMAHTMNNIVGAIRVWAATLEHAAQAKPQTPLSSFKKELGRIQHNAEEAIKLISTMTGPLEQAAVAPTDLHSCLAAAIVSCWWPDNIQLEQQLGPDMPPVRANAKRLETVFHNLLSNAVQALTPQGGHICVQTRLSGAGEVAVSIADNGPGIPPDLQTMMFNPGVSGTAGGLGIGLWLVETFIHQFDGRIDFTSSAVGTTFMVTLQVMQ